MNAIKEISEKASGWWCVFEDDCMGDFNEIKNNIFVKNIVYRTNKGFINLSAHKNNEDYSLSRVHFVAVGYLVKAEKAREIVNIIEKNKWKYDIDTTFSMELCDSNFPFNNGNSIGASVNLLHYDNTVVSERESLNT